MATSIELREQAIGLLAQARDLAPDGIVSAEARPRFDAIMAEFKGVDDQVSRAEANEGEQSRLSERWGHYTGKLTGQPMRFSAVPTDPTSALTAGQQFVASEEYQRLKAQNLSADAHFRTAPVTVAQRVPYGAAASDVVTTTGAPGNAQGIVAPYRPGLILPLPQRPLAVRDLFPSVNMPSGDTVEYAQQTGFDNGAKAVGQALATTGTTRQDGLKPQSSIGWEERSARATWVATWMVATRQAMSDEPQMASLIDNQGRLMIGLAEEDQLIRGTGTSPDLSGILDQVIQTLDLGSADNLDGIRTARRLVRTGLSRLAATFVILNPIDSEEFDILKDGFGQYRGGNPIGGGGGNGDQPIWRLQRVESEAVAEGHALVGARAGATIFDREPLRVLIADQHADFFVRNLVVVLFEERLAFPVYFPSAFVDVTLNNWTSGSGGVAGSGAGLPSGA